MATYKLSEPANQALNSMIQEHASFTRASSNPYSGVQKPFLDYSDAEFDARLLVLQHDLGQERIQRRGYLANLNKKRGKGSVSVEQTTPKLYDPASFKYEQVKAQYDINIEQTNDEIVNQQREQDEQNNQAASGFDVELERMNDQILKEQREEEKRDRARIQARLREQNLVMARAEKERAEMERLGKIKLEMGELATQLIEKEKLKKEMLEKRRWAEETLKMSREQYELLQKEVRESGLPMSELLRRRFEEWREKL